VAAITRLGVLGGSFDPIHIGHLLVAQTAAEALALQRVLFVPAGVPPHKIGKHQEDADVRLAMVRSAVSDNPLFAVSTVDLDRPAPQYTADTLALLQQEYGLDADSLFFILGSDLLAKLHTWHRPDQVAAGCRLVAIQRPGYALDLDGVYSRVPQSRGRIHVVNMPALGVSSSLLRQMVREGRSLRYWVPEAVAAIIAEKGLYRVEHSSDGAEVH
jgi:nicotinate-nucleotide adenylyltransferase